MPNYAKDRLELLLNVMRANNWSSFNFPGGNVLRFGQLLELLQRGETLAGKTNPDVMREAKQCWRNATELEQTDSQCVYWEGVIANEASAWPTPHAWNVRDGVIVDSTPINVPCDYFGVVGHLFTKPTTAQ